MRAIILKNDVLEARVCDFGATLLNLYVKDRQGNVVDVVLGYDELQRYCSEDGYLGATVGRVCNRIKNGTFDLNHKMYQLATNNGPNHLHGGIKGFSYQSFDIVEQTKSRVVLQYVSKHLEEGYPGNLTLKVIYELDDNCLNMKYEAVSDKDTLINITNHSYYNLSHEDTIDNHELMIRSDVLIEANKDGLATGKEVVLDGKPYDFRQAKIIKGILECQDEHIVLGNGLDHPFVFNHCKNQVCLFSPKSGIEMVVSTTLPQAQIYSANYLDGRMGKQGKKYNKHAGICIETQNMPDAIHLEDTPTTILKKGERYCESTQLIFKVR